MLSRWIPNSLVRLFARPYVAGDSVGDALEVARSLWEQAGLHSTLDLLAEEVATQERIDANRLAYRELVEAVAAEPRVNADASRPTVSVKLSSFTLSPMDRGGDGKGCRESLEEIAELARDRQVALTVDMEDHTWTDFTLEVAIDLFRRGFDVGTVLQTRLHRTEQDLSRIPEGMRVRMVIGIYVEPSDIALTDKRPMKERLVLQSQVLLDRGVYVEFATHDEAVLRRFFDQVVVPGKIAGSRYEVQMLYGVPRAQILRQVQAGALTVPELETPKVRLYVPFATDWDQATAYCRRRLEANPDVAIYVARNVFGALFGGRPGISQYLQASGNGK